MCGRYGLSVTRPQLSAHFPHVEFPLSIAPRYNVAPTQDVVVVVRQVDGALRGELLRWGIEPPRGGRTRLLINVRSETAARNGFFRTLLDHERVVLPASHFYEWRGSGPERQPLVIRPRQGQDRGGEGMRLLALAGLLGRWTDPRTGDQVPAVTILTCPPNELIAPVHDRMPVILDPAGWRAWLDPELGADAAAGLLVPCPADWLEVRPASRLVNDHRHEGPELLEPEPARPDGPRQLSLLE